MLNIDEITNIYDFNQLAPIWNSILTDSEADTVFLTWEWIHNWWNVYKKNKKLCVLVIRNLKNEIIGIAPLYIRKKKIFKLIGVNEICFIGSGEDVSPDYLNFIIKRGKEEEALKAFIDHLYMMNDWHVINLSDILSTSSTLKILREIAEKQKLKWKESECAICPFIRLPASWEEYLTGLSKNMRNNIKRRINTLEKKLKTKYYIWEDRDRLKSAMEKLMVLHSKRWENRSTKHAFSSQKSCEFHQSVAEEFALRGWLELSCLEINGEISGMFYDFYYKDKIYYFQGGFDPIFNSYSLGLALRADTIRKAIMRGITELDLLKGSYGHKYRWTDHDRHTITMTVGKNCISTNLFFFNAFKKPLMKAKIQKHLPDSLTNIIKKIRSRM